MLTFNQCFVSHRNSNILKRMFTCKETLRDIGQREHFFCSLLYDLTTIQYEM